MERQFPPESIDLSRVFPPLGAPGLFANAEPDIEKRLNHLAATLKDEIGVPCDVVVWEGPQASGAPASVASLATRTANSS